MAADRFIYCLEQITDYIQFERLCHDLMAAEGYTNIEPLGGSQDKGRDAIHVDRGNPDDVTIFAYSVREDWKVKLKSDCRTIHGHGHACRHLVFLCTELFTPDERDKAVNDIKSHYGWQLELYGLERLRVLLSTIRTQIVANHPSIFCPPFFPQAGGLSAVASPDYLVVDYAAPDEALATWLSRRLTLAGYQVWCRSLAPIAGASLGDTIQTLLGSRAFRFLAILSPASLNDPDLCARRSLAALTRDGILLPIAAASFDESRLDTKTRSLEILHFADSWATGLARLLDVLSAAQCPRSPGGGIGIALRSFMPSSVVSLDPETVVSNQFRVLEIPKNLHRFKSDEPVDLNTVNQASLQWAFRRVDPQHFLSFHQPPDDLRASLCLQTEGEQWWAPCETIDGIAVRNLIPELVRKSLIVACIKKGLCFCPNRKHLYFPAGLLPAERLKLTRPNGTRSFIHVSPCAGVFRCPDTPRLILGPPPHSPSAH